MGKEFKVGLLVVVAGVVLYLGFNFLKGKDFFSSTKNYYVQYDNIDGLTISNPVILNGFVVGRVDGIEILHDKEDSLLVSFTVKETVAVNSNTVAELASSNLLGGKSLKIYLNDGPLLEKGSYVKPDKEESLTSILERTAVPVISNVDTLVEGLKRYTQDGGANEKNITNAIVSLKNTMDNMEKASLLLTKMLAENQNGFKQVVGNFSEISTELKTTMNDLDPIIQNMGVFSDSLKRLDINSTLMTANATLKSVETLMSNVSNEEGSLGKLMNSDDLHKSLEITLRDVDYLVTDIQANPSRYININMIGGKTKDEKALLKSIEPKNITNNVTLKLKREAPLLLAVKLYRADRTAVEIIPNGIGTKEVSFDLPADFTRGSYIARLDWEVSSESFSFEVK